MRAQQVTKQTNEYFETSNKIIWVGPIFFLNGRLIEPGFELTKPSTGQDYTVNIQESKTRDTS
jgi:hypothetical protein